MNYVKITKRNKNKIERLVKSILNRYEATEIHIHDEIGFDGVTGRHALTICYEDK